MSGLPEHCHGEKTHFSRDERRTITPFTYPLVFLLTCQFAISCQLFRKKFNIMGALFIHQAPTLPQKIDSREGLFWCKMGLACASARMNFYLKEPPFAPVFGLFAVKCSAFCC